MFSPAAFQGVVRDGLTIEGLQIGPHPEAVEDEDEAKRRQIFAITDAAAVLHHVSETLLRLYFGHVERKPCPWLEIARQRNPRAFKRTVQARFAVPELPDRGQLDATSYLFFGTPDREKLSPVMSEVTFASALDNIEAWLRFFAGEFLDNAHLYNAVKHGLAVHAGESAFKIDDGSIFSAEGASVLYLEERTTDARKVWTQTTHWLPLDHTLAAVKVGISLIGCLWEVAKLRYTTTGPQRIQAFLGPSFKDFSEARTKNSNGVVITKMSWDLSYYDLAEVEAAGE